MPADQSPKIEAQQKPHWELPEIKDVQIRSAPFKPPALKNFDHPLDTVPDAMEIVISLAAPIPIRALSPVLWVGDQKLTESEVADKEGKKMRFWAFEPQKLAADAPIVMLWMNDQPPINQKKAKFTYRQPK
ncbi:MAG TPA: hypothetical protein VHR66_26210 [Gemmataceae bacterium]|jgi:hypothetical protein|nr:hypothetical protein [Gemmataceae bacterium]